MRLIGEVLFAVLWAVSVSMTLLFVAVRMLHVGLSATPRQFGALLHDRAFLARALLANVVVVPAVGLAIAFLLPLPSEAAIAVLLVAAVGGGVNILAARESAPEFDLTAPLVVVLSTVTILISPLIRVLLEWVGAPPIASLWRLIAIATLGALAPLAAGVLVRRVAPAAADLVSNGIGLVAVILAITTVLSTLLLKAATLRTAGGGGVLAMMLLIVAARGTGWLLGGPSPPRRALLARVTAARNAGLSLLLAIVSFPDGGAAVVVLLYIVVEIALRVLAMAAAGASLASVALPSRWQRKP